MERRTDFSEEEYKKFVFNLSEGLIVVHKKLGQGVFTAMDETNVTILFGDVEKTFNLRVLFSNKLMEVL